MVDALRRARQWLRLPFGCVIDLRPAGDAPVVELGLSDGSRTRIGALSADDERRDRHVAADRAVVAAVKHGWFQVEDEHEFAFYRYPDSAEELREYVATKRRHMRLDDATYQLAIDVHRDHPEGRLSLREQVAIRVLRLV